MNQNKKQNSSRIEQQLCFRKEQFFEGVRCILMSSPWLPHVGVLVDRYALSGESPIVKSGCPVTKAVRLRNQKGAEAFYFMLMKSSLGTQIRALGDSCGLSGTEIRAEVLRLVHKLLEVALVGDRSN